jgi:hypothetical protein
VIAVAWAFMTMLAALGLMACSRREPHPVVLPVVRTTALILTITALGTTLYR